MQYESSSGERDWMVSNEILVTYQCEGILHMGYAARLIVEYQKGFPKSWNALLKPATLERGYIIHMTSHISLNLAGTTNEPITCSSRNPFHGP